MKTAECHPDRKHAAHGLCQPCYMREYLAANPEKALRYRRAANLKRNFHMTPTEFRALLAAQQFRCACCGTLEAGGKYNVFHVDHDHSTGKIRGLLCHGCNTGIGSLGDNIEGLRKAVAYLGRSALG